MRIGELARSSGCRTETIRYYEAQGLLQPADRTANNYREYGPTHVERLAFIRRCRSLDLSQAEVRALIALQERPGKSCDDVDDLLDGHLRELSERISQLQTLRRQIREIRGAVVEIVWTVRSIDSSTEKMGSPVRGVRHRQELRACSRCPRPRWDRRTWFA